MTWPDRQGLVRIGLYVLLAVLGYHFLRTIGKGDTALDAWLTSGRQQHETVVKLLERDAQDRQKALSAAARARELAQASQEATQRFQALASAFRAHLDSAHSAPDTAAFKTVVQACFNAVELCKMRGDSLQRSDSLNRGRADSLKAALLRSDSSLAAGLHVVECRWLILRCPTRAHAFELGVGLGILGGIIISRR